MRRRLLLWAGSYLAILVYGLADDGQFGAAKWIERTLLNPIQRRGGAVESDYAVKAERTRQGERSQ